jgi:hypothetical protein
MRLKKFKKLMALGAAASAITVSSIDPAEAQTPVKVQLTTDSAITVTDGVDGELGSWLIVIRSGETVTLTQSTSNCTVTNTSSGTNSTVINLSSAGVACGTVLVKVPAAGVVLQMTRSAIADFPDAGVALDSVTYGTATQGDDQALAAATGKPVTIVGANTDETIKFGTVTKVTASPADATDAEASFNVTFAY